MNSTSNATITPQIPVRINIQSTNELTEKLEERELTQEILGIDSSSGTSNSNIGDNKPKSVSSEHEGTAILRAVASVKSLDTLDSRKTEALADSPPTSTSTTINNSKRVFKITDMDPNELELDQIVTKEPTTTTTNITPSNVNNNNNIANVNPQSVGSPTKQPNVIFKVPQLNHSSSRTNSPSSDLFASAMDSPRKTEQKGRFRVETLERLKIDEHTDSRLDASLGSGFTPSGSIASSDSFTPVHSAYSSNTNTHPSLSSMNSSNLNTHTMLSDFQTATGTSLTATTHTSDETTTDSSPTTKSGDLHISLGATSPVNTVNPSLSTPITVAHVSNTTTTTTTITNNACATPINTLTTTQSTTFPIHVRNNSGLSTTSFDMPTANSTVSATRNTYSGRFDVTEINEMEFFNKTSSNNAGSIRSVKANQQPCSDQVAQQLGAVYASMQQQMKIMQHLMNSNSIAQGSPVNLGRTVVSPQKTAQISEFSEISLMSSVVADLDKKMKALMAENEILKKENERLKQELKQKDEHQ